MPILSRVDRCKIPDRFTVIPVGGGEFRFHSLTLSLTLNDRDSGILGQLIPLLRHAITVSDIIGTLRACDEEAVLTVLDRLAEIGVLEQEAANESSPLPDAEARRLRSQIAFLSNFVPPPNEKLDAAGGDPLPRSGNDYQIRIRQAHVAVFGGGRLGSQVVRALCLAGVGRITVVDGGFVEQQDLGTDAWFAPEDNGLSRAEAVRRSAIRLRPDLEIESAEDATPTKERLESATFAVLCADSFEPALYEAFNELALATGTPWTSGRMAGLEFHIGPTVIPFETACYKCFELRFKSNLPDLSEYQLFESFISSNRVSEGALAFSPAPSLLALEVLKSLAWFASPATWGRMYSFNLVTLEARLHPVLKLPRCPACGRPAQSRPTVHAWQQAGDRHLQQ
jgi:thiazole/oxazole-forming peptide maturase SagC family component